MDVECKVWFDNVRLDQENNNVILEMRTYNINDATMYCNVLLKTRINYNSYDGLTADDMSNIYEQYEYLRKFGLVK